MKWQWPPPKPLPRQQKLAGCAKPGLSPRLYEWAVVPQVADATAQKAQEKGIAALSKTAAELLSQATDTIRRAQESIDSLMHEGSSLTQTPLADS